MPRPPQRVLTSLGYLTLKAGVFFHQVIEEILGGLGLNSRQFLLLTFLAEDDVLSQLELSKRLGLDPTIVVGLLDDLQDRGLLERHRDPADRRRHVLELTSKGRTLQKKATAAVGRAEQQFFEALSASERETVRKATFKVMRTRLPYLSDEPAP